ncbi:MAG: hypothetical protein ACR2FN_08090 [Chitinophagaceae bacterium]
MKAKILILTLILTALAACKKDLYTTAPQLKFLSVNADVFPQNSILQFKIQVTDKEGDIQDTFWVQQISINACADTLTQPYQVPDFAATKDLKGEFDITYAYGDVQGYPFITGCSLKNDSCYFRFWLKDKANHISDTISSSPIVLLNQ